MKKILINALQLNNKNSGVQYYTRNLINAIGKPEYNFTIQSLVSKNYLKENDCITPIFINFYSQNRFKRIYLENFILPKKLYKENFSLYHATNYVLPYFLKFSNVLTIHDLLTFDFPELCQNRSVLYFKKFIPRSIKNANAIIVPSQVVKKDILRYFREASEKIHVIYHGVNSIFKKERSKDELTRIKIKYQLPDKYILFVGNIEPKKNLEGVLMAFHQIRNKTGHLLVIAGKKGWKYKNVFRTVHSLKLHNKVVFTGYFPEHDLPALYSMADLFVFPSIYEGFGIPPLEAMACEVPVLVSNKGSLPEITGGKCVQVNPYDVEDIAKNMYRLLIDDELRKKSVKEGRQWVKQFTWERTAEQTLKVYHSVLDKEI